MGTAVQIPNIGVVSAAPTSRDSQLKLGAKFQHLSEDASTTTLYFERELQLFT